MLNKEKYVKEILDIISKTGEVPAVANNKPIECDSIQCKDCEFNNIYSCKGQFVEWANSEYKEPEIDWTKVPVDTPVYVRDSSGGQWNKRHFHKFDVNSKLYYCYYDGQTSWTSEEDGDDAYTYWEQCKIAEGVDCSEWYKD